MPDIKSLAYSRNVDMVNTFTKSLTKLTMMLSACEPIKAAPSETLHQKKITGKLTAEEYGIIPAYAGSTHGRVVYRVRWRDHPRVCGEHGLIHSLAAMPLGSSPRMRGARAHPLACRHALGIIPAYAGSTHGSLSQRQSARDHPRVCGEHFTTVREWQPFAGSSPRMRGAQTSGANMPGSVSSSYSAAWMRFSTL